MQSHYMPKSDWQAQGCARGDSPHIHAESHSCRRIGRHSTSCFHGDRLNGKPCSDGILFQSEPVGVGGMDRAGVGGSVLRFNTSIPGGNGPVLQTETKGSSAFSPQTGTERSELEPAGSVRLRHPKLHDPRFTCFSRRAFGHSRPLPAPRSGPVRSGPPEHATWGAKGTRGQQASQFHPRSINFAATVCARISTERRSKLSVLRLLHRFDPETYWRAPDAAEPD